MPMQEEQVALGDLKEKWGVDISAVRLTPLAERRIRISLPNGGKIVLLYSEEGNVQNAASFKGVDDEKEIVIVQDGSMKIWYQDAVVEPSPINFPKGKPVELLPSVPHATHPAKGSWLVGIMTGDWSKVKRIPDPEFDEDIAELG